MSIDDPTIDGLQTLACLRLDPAERERLAGDLQRILGYVDQLRALDTEGVEPTTSVIEIGNVLRADEPHTCLTPEQALAAAPRRRSSYFEVPVVKGEQP
jgi:aspartyl-tRNA(Asn)/glutamyl-tRNA(Gln) amidotransferase subunit C